MSRRDNSSARCLRCCLHASLCICDQIPRLVTLTRLLLVLHYKEARKPTNSGRLAAECLPNSEVWVRGHGPGSADTLVPDRDRLSLLLYPAEDAIPLTEFSNSERPIRLIVPDGTWRQASKVRHRVVGLKDVPRVTLPEGPVTEYRLRHELREGGLATMEAIARAFGILEGTETQEALERIFRIMVDRARWARGELKDDEVTGGIPQGVLRHDPSSGASRPFG